MTEAEFRALAAQGYNRIPLVLESFADLDTPLSLYVKLANERNTFLLESVVGGERFGRYSFIGVNCAAMLTERDGTAAWLGRAPRGVPEGGRAVRLHGGDTGVRFATVHDPQQRLTWTLLANTDVSALPST